MKNEIQTALLLVDIATYSPQASVHWKVLFDYYNKKNSSQLGMSCKPCFYKVYQFCTRALLTEQIAA